MSDDVKPDVKPDLNAKIQLTVNFNGSSVKYAIKRTQAFEKVFNAAADHFNADMKALKFRYMDRRVLANETPEELDMEDNDELDAVLEQIGGGF